MKPRRKITPAIVVEGKYDKIRLESAVDAVILVTGGFRIYHNAEQLALIRYYAETTGIVIRTDADAAGFQIRSYLKSTIRTGTIYHVYIQAYLMQNRANAAILHLRCSMPAG